MRWAVFLALAFLLSGCLEGDTAGDGEAAGDDDGITDDEGPSLLTYQGTFDLLINPDTEAIAVGGTSTNCVFFWDTDGATFTVHRGNATLTWTELPNTMALRLRVTGAADDPSTGPGGSPLVLEFEGLTLDHPWGIGFWADYSLAEGTAPVAQSATLDVDLEYTGTLPEPGLGTCAGGGP